MLELDLKRVHVARYGLILKQDGAIWLRIILKPLLTQTGTIKDQHIQQKVLKSAPQPAKRMHKFGYSRFKDFVRYVLTHHESLKYTVAATRSERLSQM